MPARSTGIPVLLFPLKIETRFFTVKGEPELWIRVLPDQAFLQSHNPHLTPQELSARTAYFKKIDRGEESPLDAWGALVEQYGAYRAAYLVHVSDEQITQNDVKLADADLTFYYKGLPERLSVFLYYRDDSQELRAVEMTSLEAKSDEKETVVVFGDGDEWVKDFGKAEDIGMAVRIRLIDNNRYEWRSQPPEKFERVIVTGFYSRREVGNNQKQSAEGIQALFENHLYTEGISFIPYGTATNNLGGTQSAFSIRDEFDANATYPYLVNGKALSDQSIGRKLERGLGLAENSVRYFQHADQEHSRFKQLLQKCTWMALGGHSIKLLLGDQLSSEMSLDLWKHYHQFLSARGWFSMIKIDDQPYGILPVTQLGKLNLDNTDGGLSDLKNQEVKASDFTNKLQKSISIFFDHYTSLLNANEDSLDIPRFEKHLTLEDQDQDDKRFDTLEAVLSMRPASARYEWVVWSYRKLRERVPHWLQEQLGISDTLGRMTVGEACQLLAQYGDSGLAQEFALIQARVHALTDHFDDVDESNLQKLPIYSFEELEAFEKPLSEELHADLFVFPEGDIQALKEVFGQLNTDLGAGTGSSTTVNGAGEIVWSSFLQYLGSDSYLSHLLLRSYSNMLVHLGSHPELKLTLEEFTQDVLHLLEALEAEAPDDQQREQLLREALGELFDLNSYRLDAWMSSLANARLDQIRDTSAGQEGLYFGAYGWVENLEQDTEAEVEVTIKNGEITELLDRDRLLDGGVIHCPTPAQSLTATFFKNAYLTHLAEEGEANPYTLNLTSDRVQLSERFMQGIREDQEVEALLGYRLERYLHEADLDVVIYPLRKKYPLEVNIINRAEDEADEGFTQMSVINGLMILEAYKQEKRIAELEIPNYPDRQLVHVWNQVGVDELRLRANAARPTDEVRTVLEGIASLENILDASLDHLFFEAGHQLTQGNLSQSSAAMDAVRGVQEPPETEALKTKIPGTGLSHRIAYIFPMARSVTDPMEGRAFIEPQLDTWLRIQLGPLNKIGCLVQLIEEVTEEIDGGLVSREVVREVQGVTLDQLQITHSDLFYFSDQEVSDGASELELRIVQQLDAFDPALSYRIIEEAPADCSSLADAMEIVRSAKQLIRSSRSFRQQDLSVSGVEMETSLTAFISVFSRLNRLVKMAETTWQPTEPEQLRALAQLNLPAAKRAFLNGEELDPTALDRERTPFLEKAKKWLNIFDDLDKEDLDTSELYAPLQAAAKTLFGDDFMLFPPVRMESEVIESLNDTSQKRLIGKEDQKSQWGQARVQTWMQELAQVNKGAGAFEEWQMIQQQWQEERAITRKDSFRLAQFPTKDAYPWIGLSKTEIDDLLKSDVYRNQEIYADQEEGTYPAEDIYYPSGSESLILVMEDPIRNSMMDSHERGVTRHYYGFVIDEFTEHIPDEKVDTGLSFSYDGPNNEAPQCLLLAVSSPFLKANEWSAEALNEIIRDTMDLYKIRMVSPERIRHHLEKLVDEEKPKEIMGLLPMIHEISIPTIN